MAKSVKKNYLYSALYQILLFFIPLVTQPYLARVLKPDGVGTASFLQSVTAYFVMAAALGSGVYGQREIAYAQENPEKRTIAFWEVKILQVFTASLAIGAYWIFSVRQDQPALYLALSFQIVARLVDVTWLFQGMEDFGFIVGRNIVFKVLNLLFIFGCIRKPSDLFLYLLSLGVFETLANCTLWIRLPKYVGKPILADLHAGRHVKGVLTLFIPFIAIQIYTVLDKTMIGLLTGDAFENGYYEQAGVIPKMLLSVLTALGTVLGPRVGKMYGDGDREGLKQLMLSAYRFVWFLGLPMAVGLCLVAGDLVPWYLGEGYEPAIPLLRILAFLIPVIGFSGITGMQYMVPTKQEKQFTVTVTAGAIANFCLNLLLIPHYKAMGAAVASIVAESLITCLQFWMVRKVLNIRLIWLSGRHYLVAAFLMGMVLYPLAGFWPSDILHTLCLTVSGAVIYFVILLAMKDQIVMKTLETVHRKLKK